MKDSLGIFYISYQENYLNPKSIKAIYFSAFYRDLVSLQESIQLISKFRQKQHHQSQISFSLPSQHSLPSFSQPNFSPKHLQPIQLIGSSLIFHENDIDDIRKYLPFIHQNHNWFRLYALSSDGTSFTALYHSTYRSYPLILVILTNTGERIGSYLSKGIQVQNHYYGTGESFVFKLQQNSQKLIQSCSSTTFNKEHDPTPSNLIPSHEFDNLDSDQKQENNQDQNNNQNQVINPNITSFQNDKDRNYEFKCWKSSGLNQFYISSTNQDISIGGPNCAIWFDSKMQKGFSDSSLTFNSPQLVSSSPFSIIDIEIWRIGGN